jgi:hypothetical protein
MQGNTRYYFRILAVTQGGGKSMISNHATNQHSITSGYFRSESKDQGDMSDVRIGGPNGHAASRQYPALFWSQLPRIERWGGFSSNHRYSLQKLRQCAIFQCVRAWRSSRIQSASKGSNKQWLILPRLLLLLLLRPIPQQLRISLGELHYGQTMSRGILPCGQ